MTPQVDAARRDEDPIASYAASILAQLERNDGAPVRLRLPSLDLELLGGDPDYLAACQRTLTDDPVYAGGSRLRLTLATGQGGLPPPPREAFEEGVVGIAERLAAVGLRGAFDQAYGVWQVYDPRRGRGVQLSLEGSYAPWETSFTLRNFLHWHYEQLGLRLVHAATLGDTRGGVLLCGEGGAGKSGTTLGGMLQGLASVGDDYVVLDLADQRPTAWPIARLMKQDANGLSRLGLDPAALGAMGPNWQDKYEIDTGVLPDGSRVERLPLVALVMPRLTGGPCRVRRAAGREAMLAFAPSNLRQLPGGFETGMAFMARVVRALPAYHLDLSADPVEVAAAIRGIIGDAVA